MTRLLTHPTIQRPHDPTIQRFNDPTLPLPTHHQTTKLPNHQTIQEAAS